jgi:hypothetical protein
MSEKYMSSIAKEQPVVDTEAQTLKQSEQRVAIYEVAIKNAKTPEEAGKFADKLTEELEVQYAYYEEKSQEAEAVVDATPESESKDPLEALKKACEEKARAMAKTESGKEKIEKEVKELAEDLDYSDKKKSSKTIMKITGLLIGSMVGLGMFVNSNMKAENAKIDAAMMERAEFEAKLGAIDGEYKKFDQGIMQVIDGQLIDVNDSSNRFDEATGQRIMHSTSVMNENQLKSLEKAKGKLVIEDGKLQGTISDSDTTKYESGEWTKEDTINERAEINDVKRVAIEAERQAEQEKLDAEQQLIEDQKFRDMGLIPPSDMF